MNLCAKHQHLVLISELDSVPWNYKTRPKLRAGDLIAQDAMYHLRCLVSLYNWARETKAASDSDPDALNHGIIFAELVSYIEDVQTNTEVAPIFKLADLVSLYATRLKQLGTNEESHIHSTKLKERLLSYFPDMQAGKKCGPYCKPGHQSSIKESTSSWCR